MEEASNTHVMSLLFLPRPQQQIGYSAWDD